MKKTNVLNKDVFLIFFTVLMCCSPIKADEKYYARFPGVVSQIVSPDKKYVVINVDSESEKHTLKLGGNHALYVRNLHTGKQEKIYSYNRSVEVLWSPKSRKLLVNDYSGSDYAIPIIFFIDKGKKPIDVKKHLRQTMSDNQSIFHNHHVYIVGTEWFSETSLHIKIYGYGDVNPDGFVLWFEYVIGEGFKKIE